MTDTDNSEGKATARVAVAGATGASSTDLWFGTANLNAIVTNPSGTDIKIRYRIAGTETGETADQILTRCREVLKG